MINKILGPIDLSELRGRVFATRSIKLETIRLKVTIYHVFTVDEIRKLSDRIKKHWLHTGEFSNLLETHV
jgi:hypothetical protein